MPSMILTRRAPQRLTITVPQILFDWIHHQANVQGRSASNLCAYLLEQARDRSDSQAHGPGG